MSDTINVEQALASIPSAYHDTARVWLAQVAALAPGEALDALRVKIVDATLAQAKDGGWCTEAEAALTTAFGRPTDGVWRMSDGSYRDRDNGRWFGPGGLDRDGYDVDGFNADGRNRNGFDRDGFDRHGFDCNGYGRDGFSREGFDRDGFDRDGFDRHGFNRDGLNPAGQSRYRFDDRGYDAAGFNIDGYDRNGYNRWGVSSDGYDRSGQRSCRFDQWGYDRNGTHFDGHTRPVNWTPPADAPSATVSES